MNESSTALLQIYVHHLFQNAKGVSDGCDFVFAAAHTAPSESYLKNSPAVHVRIDSVLIAAANVKKLIVTPEEKSKKESARAFKFRRQRTEYLMAALAGLPLDTFMNARVRNSQEHFDEYLDDLGGRYELGGEPQMQIAYGVAFSSASMARVIGGMPYPLRLYVADEQTYYNFEENINLGTLKNEAAGILDRLVATLLKNGRGEPGGLIIRIPAS